MTRYPCHCHGMSDEVTLSVETAAEIRAMLARLQITGRELARRLDVSQPWVSYRLTGAQEIGLDDIQRIAEAIGVEWWELLPQRDPSLATVTRLQPRTLSTASRGRGRRRDNNPYPAQPDHATRRPPDGRPEPRPGNESTRRPARKSAQRADRAA